MLLLDKGTNLKLSDNLFQNQIDCKCNYIHCKTTMIFQEAIDKFLELNRMTNLYLKGNGKEYQMLQLSSGYRCQHHNYDVGGKDKSRHLSGMALDIICPKELNFDEFHKMCCSQFKFVLPYRYKNFCHCDIDRR